MALVAAHLVADFLLQTNWLVDRKSKVCGMALHIGCVVVIAFLALGFLDAGILGAVLVTHLAMDVIKTHWLPKTLWSFLLDQAVHLAVIAVLAVCFPAAASQGWWDRMEAPDQAIYYGGLAALSGLILSVLVGGIVIGMLMDPLARSINDTQKGLKNGGRYIGWLERGLALVFFLIGQPEGIGLLLAAKSVLRFGDIAQTKEREHTEYVVIGTMLSFGWALAVAVVTKAVVHHWKG